MVKDAHIFTSSGRTNILHVMHILLASVPKMQKSSEELFKWSVELLNDCLVPAF
jgi:hypothetical protein